jgi:uncharacterized phiE125 gp8 family phage protein
MISVVIPPYAEPVTLTETKNALKQDTDITTDDDLIQSRIASARNIVETDTGANVPRCKVMLVTTFDLTLHCFPWWNPLTASPYSHISLPRVPLISVTSITYVDTAGTTQTMSSSLYVVDYAKGRIHLAYNESWPSTRSQPNAVTVRFVAGMAASFTAATTDVLTVQGRAFTVGDRVRVVNSGGALPTGLLANTDYFVIADGKLSLTSGGSAVDITGTGSGTHYIASALDMASFRTLQTAVMQKVASFYMNRGDGGMSAAEYNAAERLYEHCIASEHA